MKATISMPIENLWTMIQTMSVKNKRWLTERLIEDLNSHNVPPRSDKEEILAGIVRGFKDIKEGRTYPLDEIWRQL